MDVHVDVDVDDRPPLVLVIAGFDPSGGAGVLRDARTLDRIGVRSLAVVTAVTAQDGASFDSFRPIDPDLLLAQLRSVTRVASPTAVKIGMLGSRANAEAVAAFLRDIDPLPPVVLDPVLTASAGGLLTDDGDLSCLRSVLLPLSSLVTPNGPEAEVLSGLSVRDMAGMERAASALVALGAGAALVKGGHIATDETVTDLLVTRDGIVTRLERPRLPGGIHGSGCLHSSAIAGFLARGLPLAEAAKRAAEIVAEEMEQAFVR